MQHALPILSPFARSPFGKAPGLIGPSRSDYLTIIAVPGGEGSLVVRATFELRFVRDRGVRFIGLLGKPWKNGGLGRMVVEGFS